MGLDHADDAGVFKLSDETALIQTLDFLTPIVDDPYDFGRIAAANALSDVYAMGGKPLTAMNIICFPSETLPESVLEATLNGGLAAMAEAGAVLVGGHSVDDAEFKYGLSVTGVVHPERVLTNGGLVPGDRLILTKPLGTGILSTAIKGKVAGADAARVLVDTAGTLNRAAAEVMKRFPVRGCTDVTGFGLAGHLLEMARASRVRVRVSVGALPVLPEVPSYAAMGLIPAGAYKNRRFCGDAVSCEAAVPLDLADVFFDPQTSGGLLFGVPAESAADCLLALSDAGITGAAGIGTVEALHSCGAVHLAG